MPPHCDSLDGPVVIAARAALEMGDVDIVLPYVHEDGWDEVRRAHAKTMVARAAGDEACDVADLWFFETVVRIHRAGEGAPYTGLKPAGLDVGPVIPVAERAIEQGSPDDLVVLLTKHLEDEVRSRFDHVVHLAAEKGRGLHQARRFVAASLDLMVWAHQMYQGIGAVPHEAHQAHSH